MANAKIIFREALLDIQDYEPDEIERKISRLHFDFELDSMLHVGLKSIVKQLVQQPENIEISSPANYGGWFCQDEFCAAARQYYLDLLATQSPGIRSNRRAVMRVVEIEVNQQQSHRN